MKIDTNYPSRGLVALILVLVMVLCGCESVFGPDFGEMPDETAGTIPEEYMLVSFTEEVNGVFSYVYRNSTDAVIIFSAVPIQNSSVHLDTEGAIIRECSVGRYTGQLIEEEPKNMFVWVEPELCFFYTVKAINISQTEFFEITEILLDSIEK